MTDNSQIQIFETLDGGVRLDVALDDDNVWLSQAQMCELFGRERSVLTKHINNIFKEGELVRDDPGNLRRYVRCYRRHKTRMGRPEPRQRRAENCDDRFSL